MCPTDRHLRKQNCSMSPHLRRKKNCFTRNKIASDVLDINVRFHSNGLFMWIHGAICAKPDRTINPSRADNSTYIWCNIVDWRANHLIKIALYFGRRTSTGFTGCLPVKASSGLPVLSLWGPRKAAETSSHLQHRQRSFCGWEGNDDWLCAGNAAPKGASSAAACRAPFSFTWPFEVTAKCVQSHCCQICQKKDESVICSFLPVALSVFLLSTFWSVWEGWFESFDKCWWIWWQKWMTVSQLRLNFSNCVIFCRQHTQWWAAKTFLTLSGSWWRTQQQPERKTGQLVRMSTLHFSSSPLVLFELRDVFLKALFIYRRGIPPLPPFWIVVLTAHQGFDHVCWFVVEMRKVTSATLVCWIYSTASSIGIRFWTVE